MSTFRNSHPRAGTTWPVRRVRHPAGHWDHHAADRALVCEGRPDTLRDTRSSTGTRCCGCSSMPSCSGSSMRSSSARSAAARRGARNADGPSCVFAAREAGIGNDRGQRRCGRPTKPIDGVALTVVIVIFVLAAVMGFLAARWRVKPADRGLKTLDEWGLAGRGFGNWITWFLLGGDLYTAYTFIAVPAAMWGTGAITGFFAVPYTIVLYPIVFLLMARLWSVSHRHGFVTPADFVGGRYGSKLFSTAMAVTGIVATMPYIALQLVGIKSVLSVRAGQWTNAFMADLPLIIAFVVLAATPTRPGSCSSVDRRREGPPDLYRDDRGDRLVAAHFGGWAQIFDAASVKMSATNPQPMAGRHDHPRRDEFQCLLDARARIRDGAVHVPAFDHRCPGDEEPQYDPPQRRGAAAYSLMLGFLALLGYVAIKAGTHRWGSTARSTRNSWCRTLPRQFPGLVCGHRARGDRGRGAGSRGNHVDRGIQLVHPQHLP